MPESTSKDDLAARGAAAAEADVKRIASFGGDSSDDDLTNFQDNRGAGADNNSPSGSPDKDVENQLNERTEEESRTSSTGEEPQNSGGRTSQFKKFLPGVPNVLKTSGGARRNLEANADTFKKSNALRPSALPLPGPFTNMKNKTENKVVGLGNYGLDQSFLDRRQNEWLSSTRSVNSHPPSFHPTSSSDNPPPPRNITTAPISTAPPAEETKKMNRETGEKPSTTKTTKKDAPFKHPPSLHAMASLLPPVKKKSVEELEDFAREKAIMNPFQLLYLGNVAAMKVFGFYLLTLETLITCGLVRRMNFRTLYSFSCF